MRSVYCDNHDLEIALFVFHIQRYPWTKGHDIAAATKAAARRRNHHGPIGCST
jgi:hypothetical protein